MSMLVPIVTAMFGGGMISTALVKSQDPMVRGVTFLIGVGTGIGAGVMAGNLEKSEGSCPSPQINRSAEPFVPKVSYVIPKP